MTLEKIIVEISQLKCEEAGSSSISYDMGEFVSYCAPHKRGDFLHSDCPFIGEELQDGRRICYGAPFNKPNLDVEREVKVGEQLSLFKNYKEYKKNEKFKR